MTQITRKFSLKLLVCFSAFAGLTASALATGSENLAENSAQGSPAHSRVVVFGTFRLLKNGYEAKLGDGIFSSPAALSLYRPADQEEMTVKVGKKGIFSRKLAPGEYYVASIAFKHHGETVEPDTNFVFTVPSDSAASYMGTITLETTFSSGYHGVDGEIERFVVTDDCHTDCASLLSELGMPGVAASSSFPEWRKQVALAK